MVLASQQQDADHEWESDTDSTIGVSDVEVADVIESTPVEVTVVADIGVRSPSRVFASLDVLNLSDAFDSRPRLMRCVPWVLRGAFRLPLRVAPQETVSGVEVHSEVSVVLLYRPARGGRVPTKHLESRIRQFEHGDWISLFP